MSKHNKANKNNYDQAGRLSPDDMARERQKQAQVSPATPRDRERVTNRAPEGSRGAEPASSRRRTSREE